MSGRSGSADAGQGRLRLVTLSNERPVAAHVADHLQRDGFRVATSVSTSEALRVIRDLDPDAVLIAMPHAVTAESYRRIREITDAPAVALCSEHVRSRAVSAGAHAWIRVPIDPSALGAEVGVLLRDRLRGVVTDGAVPPRVFGALCIDAAARIVTLDGERLALTRTEFDILAALSEHPDRVVTRRELIDVVWGSGWSGNPAGVHVHVGKLRRKLGDDSVDPRYVLTERGIGYRMGRR